MQTTRDLTTIQADIDQVDADIAQVEAERARLAESRRVLAEQRDRLLAELVEGNGIEPVGIAEMMRLYWANSATAYKTFEDDMAESGAAANASLAMTGWSTVTNADLALPDIFGVQVMMRRHQSDGEVDVRLLAETLSGLYGKWQPTPVKAAEDPYADDVARWGVALLNRNYDRYVIWWNPADGSAGLFDERMLSVGPEREGTFKEMLRAAAQEFPVVW